MEKINGLISIIVPIYNTENYLRKCIDSIINQTYKNIEIILVNDGSTDNCGKICDEYIDKDNRVKVMHKKNAGLSCARNSGLGLCRGEYIGFVDSDDWVEDNMFESMYSISKQNNSDITICDTTSQEKKINNKNYDNFEVKKLNQVDYCVEMFTGNSFEGYVCNKLYTSEIINKHKFEDIGGIEDLLFNYKVLNEKPDINVMYIKKGLYHYIRRDDSISFSSFSAKTFSKLKAFKFIYEDSIYKFPMISEYVFKRFIEENIYEAGKYIKADCKEEKYLLQIRKNTIDNYRRIKENDYFSTKQRISIFLMKCNLKLFCYVYKIVDIIS